MSSIRWVPCPFLRMSKDRQLGQNRGAGLRYPQIWHLRYPSVRWKVIEMLQSLHFCTSPQSGHIMVVLKPLRLRNKILCSRS